MPVIESLAERNSHVIHWQKKADNKITSIAIHSSSDDTYYTLVLDPKDNLKLKSHDNVEIETFENEFELLQKFYMIYLKIKPTII